MRRIVVTCLLAFAVFAPAALLPAAEPAGKPNILFCIADDWGWPHAGSYGDPVVQTPNFDRLAAEGVLFHHAYISSPSCTPSRGAILTGQWHWRLDAAANLWSVFPDRYVTYPEILLQHGYQTGTSGKAWGPGRTATPGRELAGKPSKNFQVFLRDREEGKPFCYWLGSSDPHRPYQFGSGKESGMDISKVPLPECYPDSDEIRSDVADYYFEVQRFDTLVGDALRSLEEIGALDNTVVVMTGDHGMPFPRGKSNLYDLGSRVPLAIRWGKNIPSGRTIDDFVSLTDLAPTFLEAAGVAAADDITGRSLMPLLKSSQSGFLDEAHRSYVLFGKERHVPSQEAPDMGGYPSRGIRTHEFLLIRNFKTDRWPNGTPDYERAAIPGTWFGDTDNGPTKTYIIENKDRDAAHRRSYELCFGKRPEFELYDLRVDPGQIDNVAADPQYAETVKKLSAQLTADLQSTRDPRVAGGGDRFDEFPYLGGGPKHPSLEKKRND